MEFIIRLILFGSQSRKTDNRTRKHWVQANWLIFLFFFQFHFSLSTKATTIRLRWLSTASDVSSSQHVPWISIRSIQLLRCRRWRREKMANWISTQQQRKPEQSLTEYDKKRRTEAKKNHTFWLKFNSTTCTIRRQLQIEQIHTDKTISKHS